MLTNITIERLDQIEKERAKTFSDPKFIKWMKQFKVSSMASNPSNIEQTRRAMESYDYSKWRYL